MALGWFFTNIPKKYDHGLCFTIKYSVRSNQGNTVIIMSVRSGSNYLGIDDSDTFEATQDDLLKAQELKALIPIKRYQRMRQIVDHTMGRVFMWVLSL